MILINTTTFDNSFSKGTNFNINTEISDNPDEI